MGLAASLELIGTWLAHPTPGRRLQSDNVAFDSEHMLERCRLFLLIALGETVITTGTAIADTPLTPTSLATGTFALAGTVALWAPTFGRTHQLISQHLEETSNPIRASRYAVNTLMVLVAGLVAVAVANEMVIAHPIGHSSIALGLLLAGGPIFFLAAQSWYLWTVLDIRSHLHLGGIVVLGLIALATQYLPPYAALILTGVTLLVIATLDQQHART